MYKKILVAVDGSETAKLALAEADHIAMTCHATLYIVYSVVHTVEGDLAADKKAGQEILAQAKSCVTHTNVETKLLVPDTGFGLASIVDAISAAATDSEADLVVAGTANRRGLKRFFLGSVAEQLMTKVNASILLVRPTQEQKI